MFLPLFFIDFKYGFSREDAHHYFDMILIMLLFLLMIFLNVKNTKKSGIFLIGCSLFFILLSANMNNIPDSVIFINSVKESLAANLNTSNGVKDIMRFGDFKDKLLQYSEQYTSAFRLPDRFKDIIGSHTVDFYPIYTQYAFFNRLSWSPRPVFQSYISYNSWLDNRNRNFFISRKAPEYLVLVNHGNSFNDVDARYFLNDEPVTIRTLIEDYTPVSSNGETLLLKKRLNARLFSESVTGPFRAGTNAPVYLPAIKSGIIKAKILMRRTFYGGLKNFFYKENQVNVYYKLDDGREITRRIAVDNIKSGMWAGPYLSDTLEKPDKNDILNCFKKTGVRYFMVMPADKDAFEKDISVSWEMLSI